MINTLQPGLWDDSALQFRGVVDYIGDLTYLEGNPVVYQTPLYEVVRPEITAGTTDIWDAEDMTHIYRRYTNTGPPGSLITAKTVLMVDSFGVEAMARIIPYFADITFVHFDSLSPEALIAEFNKADAVWIMCVERAIGYRFSDPPVEFFYPYGTREFLDTLDTQLEPKGAN